MPKKKVHVMKTVPMSDPRRGLISVPKSDPRPAKVKKVKKKLGNPKKLA